MSAYLSVNSVTETPSPVSAPVPSPVSDSVSSPTIASSNPAIVPSGDGTTVPSPVVSLLNLEGTTVDLPGGTEEPLGGTSASPGETTPGVTEPPPVFPTCDWETAAGSSKDYGTIFNCTCPAGTSFEDLGYNRIQNTCFGLELGWNFTAENLPPLCEGTENSHN